MILDQANRFAVVSLSNVLGIAASFPSWEVRAKFEWFTTITGYVDAYTPTPASPLVSVGIYEDFLVIGSRKRFGCRLLPSWASRVLRHADTRERN